VFANQGGPEKEVPMHYFELADGGGRKVVSLTGALTKKGKKRKMLEGSKLGESSMKSASPLIPEAEGVREAGMVV